MKPKMGGVMKNRNMATSQETLQPFKHVRGPAKLKMQEPDAMMKAKARDKRLVKVKL